MLSAPPTESVPVVHHGSIELTLAERYGRTRLVRSRTRPPLLLQRALYPDCALPHLALVMLANPTGGIFQGDHHHIAITVESGAAAHVTTQSSTKAHSMPDGRAGRTWNLWLPPVAILNSCLIRSSPTMTRTSNRTQPFRWSPAVGWFSGTY